MIRRLSLSMAALAVAALLGPRVHAGQEVATWEFHPFIAKASLDSGDMLFKERSLELGGGDGDGTVSSGTFTRSSSLDDNTFAGFRLGYVWTPLFESEISYDRNHTGGNYQHTIVEDGTTIERVDGRIGSVITSYQVGVLYHPLGAWKTPWQPYAAVSGGWMDVDLSPSSSLSADLSSSDAASIDFPSSDHGLLFGYGAGCKYFIVPNVAARAEIRGKTYTVFDEKRRDIEITVGLSFFLPGDV